MKRILSVVGLALIMTTGAAQAKIYLSAQGSYALPTNKLFGGGLGFGAAVGYELTPAYSLELSIRNWALSSEGSADGLSLGKASVLPVELSFRARFPLRPGVTLYGDAGAGYAFSSFSLDEDLAADWAAVGFTLDENTDNGLTAHLGFGVEIALTPTVDIDIAARYHLFQTRGVWTITDDASGEAQTGTIEGLNLGAITLSLGFKISIF